MASLLFIFNKWNKWKHVNEEVILLRQNPFKNFSFNCFTLYQIVIVPFTLLYLLSFT